MRGRYCTFITEKNRLGDCCSPVKAISYGSKGVLFVSIRTNHTKWRHTLYNACIFPKKSHKCRYLLNFHVLNFCRLITLWSRRKSKGSADLACVSAESFESADIWCAFTMKSAISYQSYYGLFWYSVTLHLYFFQK